MYLSRSRTDFTLRARYLADWQASTKDVFWQRKSNKAVLSILLCRSRSVCPSHTIFRHNVSLVKAVCLS